MSSSLCASLSAHLFKLTVSVTFFFTRDTRSRFHMRCLDCLLEPSPSPPHPSSQPDLEGTSSFLFSPLFLLRSTDFFHCFLLMGHLWPCPSSSLAQLAGVWTDCSSGLHNRPRYLRSSPSWPQSCRLASRFSFGSYRLYPHSSADAH